MNYESLDLELAASFHSALVDFDKFFYHDGSFFHKYCKSYAFFSLNPAAFALTLAFYVAFGQ